MKVALLLLSEHPDKEAEHNSNTHGEIPTAAHEVTWAIPTGQSYLQLPIRIVKSMGLEEIESQSNFLNISVFSLPRISQGFSNLK